MQKHFLKRVEALERAADKEILGDGIGYAIAYYLGGAKHFSEWPHAYARALGYQDLSQTCEPLVDLLSNPSHSLDKPSGIRARTRRAQRELLAKFGYDRAKPAALADAAYRIVRTLPEEWQSEIKSMHREQCEADAAADQIFQSLTCWAEERSKHARRTRRHRCDPETRTPETRKGGA